MTTWVKGFGSDTWHWCKNCSGYPSSIAKSQQTKPTSGELCNQCLSKEKAGTCSK